METMDRVSGAILDSLRQTFLSLCDLVTQFDAQLLYEETQGLVVIIFYSRERLVVISINGLLNVLFNRLNDRAALP